MFRTATVVGSEHDCIIIAPVFLVHLGLTFAWGEKQVRYQDQLMPCLSSEYNLFSEHTLKMLIVSQIT